MERRIKQRVLILGGGPVGRAVWSAIPDAMVLEAGIQYVRAASREHGAQFLWAEIPEFRTRRVNVITEIDGTPASEPSIRAYKKRVGRSSSDARDRAEWPLQFQHLRPAFEILSYPSIQATYNARAVSVDLSRHQVRTVTGGMETRWEYDHLVSTIPLPHFLRLRGPEMNEIAEMYERSSKPVGVWRTDDPDVLSVLQKFRSRAAEALASNESTRKILEDSIYCTYLGQVKSSFSRITYNGVVADFEQVGPQDATASTRECGLTGFRTLAFPDVVLRPGKIHQPSSFLHEAVTEYLALRDVSLVGRYGSWSKEELLHQSYARACRLPCASSRRKS